MRVRPSLQVTLCCVVLCSVLCCVVLCSVSFLSWPWAGAKPIFFLFLYFWSWSCLDSDVCNDVGDHNCDGDDDDDEDDDDDDDDDDI